MAILTIRNATENDVQAIAQIHVSSWQHTYRCIVPDVYLDSLSVARREEIWRELLAKGIPKVIVAESDGKVVGYCSFGACRDDDARSGQGEIWAIYLLPEYCAVGVGRALLSEACLQLLAMGRAHISLWVIVKNERALRFYRAAGFEQEHDSLKSFELAGTDIEEVRYVKKNAVAEHERRLKNR
jgi:ribosomal protein S18 acetylase RimI-like enzyme